MKGGHCKKNGALISGLRSSLVIAVVFITNSLLVLYIAVVSMMNSLLVGIIYIGLAWFGED
jgi:hypothetical protein